MPTKQGSSDRKYGITALRHSRLRTTMCPLASTPWTWNQCLARSKPMVVICMVDGFPRCGVHNDDHVVAHRCRGAGAVHPIKNFDQRNGRRSVYVKFRTS